MGASATSWQSHELTANALRIDPTPTPLMLATAASADSDMVWLVLPSGNHTLLASKSTTYFSSVIPFIKYACRPIFPRNESPHKHAGALKITQITQYWNEITNEVNANKVKQKRFSFYLSFIARLDNVIQQVNGDGTLFGKRQAANMTFSPAENLAQNYPPPRPTMS